METFFGSGERERTLFFLFTYHSERIRVREIAKKCRVSASLVSKTKKFLEKYSIVKNNAVDFSHPVLLAWKRLLNIKKILESGFLVELRKSCPKNLGVGVFGSWENGTNYFDSDLDVWVLVERAPSDEKVFRIRNFCRKKIGAEANILFLTRKEVERIKEKDVPFYYSLLNSIVLWGNPID